MTWNEVLLFFISIDPSNVKAREGLEKIEKIGDVSMERSYDDVDEMAGTDNEVKDIITLVHPPRSRKTDY